MPYKSDSQRRLFFAKEARGEMPEGTAERWQAETGKKKLPEHVGKKKSTARKGPGALLKALGKD